MNQGLLVVDDTRERAAYLKVMEVTNKLNQIFGANILVQPGYFLSEVLLQGGTTAYQFPTLNTEMDKSVFPLSTGVNQNDIFAAIKREFTVDNRAATTSTIIYPQTYNNSEVFTALTTKTPSHIQMIFNSNWNYQVGSKIYIQNQFTRKDLRQPLTQQSASNNLPYYNGDTLIEIDPYLVISGKATNYLNFKIQNGATPFAGDAETGANVLSCFMQGFTLQNAAGFGRFYTGDLSIEVYEQEYMEFNKQNPKGKYQTLKANDSFGNFQ